MKYLKYCENDTIGSDDTFLEQYFIGKIAGQPKRGPTVICFKNPQNGTTHMAYTGKNIYKEDESPIQYTWRYEYYNGHPAIIVNFSRLNGYGDSILCLESNNMTKGGSNIPGNKYKIRQENNNRALNVLTNNGDELNIETKNITWYRLGDLKLNTDYPIYITVPSRYIFGAVSMHGAIIPNDWEVRINIRTTIRGNLGNVMPNINSTTFRHTNHIPSKEYMLVKFPYKDIFQL